ncbi:Glu-tRNA(Gln) amidotransferase subunit GatD [Candidatus Woesearchaeota archaeon]|nr:Glu-tRNA(Gln) amidotransferase subunit GatD [Candidatus Woesearchaeota archaeon]
MKTGDKVRIEKKDGEIVEGVVMPAEKKGVVVVKLDNGYNIGIEKENIKKSEVIEEFKEVKEKKKAIKKKSGLPNITILHTGGTIASKVDYRTGGVVSKFTPEDLLEMFPELGEIANIDSKLLQNMWSDDLRFCHFEKIAKAVEAEAKKNVKGVIVGIGTDNLAVASAALAFVFAEINIPVILVGAQRSSDRGSTDAAMNLICAAEFIAKTHFTGVGICMHSGSADNTCSILPACKTKKLHTSRRDAFKVVNDSEIAAINYKTRKIDLFKPFEKGSKIVIKDKFEDKVGLLKIHVNMHASEFEAFSGFKGLVVEGTGLGHTPLDVIDDCTREHEKIKKAIKKLVDDGTVVVMTSACLFGRVNMNVYSKGRDLQESGVIPGEDMLPETAFVKLAWLLGNYKASDVKELVGRNLRGEITERSLYKEEFLE